MIKSVKSDSFEMEYSVFGCGKKALVVIPGISLKSVLLSESALVKQFEIFTKDYTVYIFDRKKNIEVGYMCSDAADDTAEAMKTIGIENADIFGASNGGMIAILIAARYPEIVNRLVVASSLYRQNKTSLDTFGTWVKMSEEGKRAELNRCMFEKIYSKEYLEKYREAFLQMEASGTDEEFARLGILAKSCLAFDASDEIGNVKCPVLAIASKKDAVLSGQASVEIAEKVGGEYYLYDGYSHAVYDEAPNFLQRINKFFGKP